MMPKPRFLDLNRLDQRYELTSEFLRREGDTVLGALRVQGGKITTADRGARVEMDIYGLRGYDAAETIVFEFDTATGSLTLKGTISAGSTITGSQFRTAEPPNKRITIGESPGDVINFYSGDSDETTQGYFKVGTQGAGAGQSFASSWFSGEMAGNDSSSIVLLSESVDGTTVVAGVAIGADNVLLLGAQTSVDATLQILGDIALQDSFSDPPASAAGITRIWNSGGAGLRTRSAAQIAPLAPHRTTSSGSSSTLVADTTLRDIPGCTVSVTTWVPNATYSAQGFALFAQNGVSVGNDLTLWLLVNGSVVTVAVSTNLTTLAWDETLHVSWGGVLPTAGVHTIKLQAAREGATGTVTVGGASALSGGVTVTTVG